VEAAGDIDVLLLDKTGTSLGNRMASLHRRATSSRSAGRRRATCFLADELPKAAVVVLAKEQFGLRGREGRPVAGMVRAVHARPDERSGLPAWMAAGPRIRKARGCHPAFTWIVAQFLAFIRSFHQFRLTSCD